MAAELGHHANRSYVDQSGNIHLNGSTLYDSAENAVAKPVGSPTAGVRMVGGETALDGSNPTAITTGLTTVTGFAATLKGSAAPGVGTIVVTYTASGGTVSAYAWKVTGTGDCTLIASTGTETFGWVATGT